MENKVLKLDEIMGFDGEIISFGDIKVIENAGEVEDVSIFIPACCREGWDSCKHVPQQQRRSKRNIGL